MKGNCQMYEVESVKLLKKVIKNYDDLPQNLKYWLDKVVNRTDHNESDLRTYLAMSKSNKDMAFFESLKLKKNLSYYVVSEQREFLEKFRVYLQVCVPKDVNDFISFSDKVFLNSYVRQVNDEKFNINEMLLSHRRLQVYCHKNNHMTDKQSAWVQGNLCDRLIRGNKVLILAEYKVDEVEELLKSFPLKKIEIRNNDLTLQGLYKVNNITDSNGKGWDI